MCAVPSGFWGGWRPSLSGSCHRDGTQGRGDRCRRVLPSGSWGGWRRSESIHMGPTRNREPSGGPGIVTRAAVVLLAALLLGACASSPPPAPATPVPITDYKMVAGKWAGHVKGLAGPRDDGDWIEMTIGDNGAYEFGIARTIGVLAGKGNFTLADGKLTMKGERGQATFALFQRERVRFLRGTGMLHTGTALSGDLTSVR